MPFKRKYFLIMKVICLERVMLMRKYKMGKLIHLNKPGEFTSKASLVTAGFKGSFHFTM